MTLSFQEEKHIDMIKEAWKLCRKFPSLFLTLLTSQWITRFYHHKRPLFHQGCSSRQIISAVLVISLMDNCSSVVWTFSIPTPMLTAVMPWRL